MPIPKLISDTGKGYHHVGDYELKFKNPNQNTENRETLTRTFSAYLELQFQSKHDALIGGYCRSINIDPRRSDGSQIRHGSNAKAEDVLKGFYKEKGKIAADATLEQMIQTWKKGGHFKDGEQINAAIQRDVQSDDYQYEISYWYYSGGEIYVLFHCYPK